MPGAARPRLFTRRALGEGALKVNLPRAIRVVVDGLSAVRHRRNSVRGKLAMVVLLTTAIALAVAGVGMLSYDLGVYRRSWAADLSTEAGILALSTAPAMAFGDSEAAVRSLNALRARPAVSAAALYDSSGRLYAQYVQSGQLPPPQQLPILEGAARLSGQRVEVSQPVQQNGEKLGTVYLRARYAIAGRVEAYVGIFGLVMLLSMVTALALSTPVQKTLTEPLEAMANIAQQVVTRRDYSLRAAQTTDDEIGLVVAAFNRMLEEVQMRTLALETSNAALRRSEQLYRAIGESIDYGVWLCDVDGRNLYASESFLRLVGLTQEQCSNRGWTEVLHPEDVAATMAAWQECIRSGEPWYREHRFRGADGRDHPILARGVAVRDERGAIVRWAGINLDIARLKQTEEALREADRRKDEFLATLAHELRNPLAPIRHAARLLESPILTDAQRQWTAEVIGRQVHRMALLLDDLLDVSRITRGRLELRKDYIDLDALVNSAVETARPLIDGKHHRLHVHLPEVPLRLAVDPLRLSQALSNLLTNAAKYTDPGGVIELTVSLTAAELIFSVRDSGIGLNAAAMPRLFEMFSQVDSAIDRAEGGLGIGLALVKGLIGLHGGSVDVSSAGPGRGSTFTLHLPRIAVVGQGPPAEAGVRTVAPVGRRYRVLVADDNRDAAESLALVLQLEGHQVTVAASGAEALQIGDRQRPQAVILDIGMPGMSGYETARRIRREAWGRHALLIALTGWGQQDDKESARSAGFDHHLTKPAPPESVNRLLQDFVDGGDSAVGHGSIGT